MKFGMPILVLLLLLNPVLSECICQIVAANTLAIQMGLAMQPYGERSMCKFTHSGASKQHAVCTQLVRGVLCGGSGANLGGFGAPRPRALGKHFRTGSARSLGASPPSSLWHILGSFSLCLHPMPAGHWHAQTARRAQQLVNQALQMG